MRYLQLRARDGAGNVSTGSAQRLVNYVPSSDRIVRGQSRIYRYELSKGQSFRASLKLLSGDADLFVWSSDTDQPLLVSNLAGSAGEYVAIPSDRIVPGVYQVEVYGYTDAEYQLASSMESSAAYTNANTHGGIDPDKLLPNTPLLAVEAVPDPLLGSMPDDPVSPEVIRSIYLPLIVGSTG